MSERDESYVPPVDFASTQHVSVKVTLTTEGVKMTVNEYLSKIIGGRFIRDGKLMVEEYTSHRFDTELGDASELRFEVVVTAIRFQERMKKAGLL